MWLIIIILYECMTVSEGKRSVQINGNPHQVGARVQRSLKGRRALNAPSSTDIVNLLDLTVPTDHYIRISGIPFRDGNGLASRG